MLLCISFAPSSFCSCPVWRARTHSAQRWKPSISLLAFTLQMLPNVSTFREIWVEDNKHCAMSQLIHFAFWRTKMPKYFHCGKCARLDQTSSEWFRFESCSRRYCGPISLSLFFFVLLNETPSLKQHQKRATLLMNVHIRCCSLYSCQ